MKIETILLVDDNEADQFLHASIISKFDPTIEIVKAYDGEEALNILAERKNEIDVILLDINMPGMDGFDFLEEYSKISSPSSVVAMLSSSEQGRDKERAMAYDCVKTYFLKPLDVKDLEALKEE